MCDRYVDLECLAKCADQVGVKRDAFEEDVFIEELIMIVSFVAINSVSECSKICHERKLTIKQECGGKERYRLQRTLHVERIVSLLPLGKYQAPMECLCCVRERLNLLFVI